MDKAWDWKMPERNKLTLEVYKKVMSTAPNRSWVAAAIADGEVLGVGPTSTEALRSAKRKRPRYEREQIVILWKEA